MADKDLTSFMSEALKAGKSRQEIADVLKRAGWSDDAIAAGLAKFADIAFDIPVPTPQRYGAAREAFLYIVFFGLLAATLGNVIALSFTWIETAFADPIDNQRASYVISSARWQIATLLVGYPVFLLLGTHLARAQQRDPDRQRSRVRIWLTYITLIFAALFLIGDLVAIVYRFLDGELNTRFFSKAAIVAIVSAGVLVNFMLDAERLQSGSNLLGRILASALTLTVIALIVWGFTVVRSPFAAREIAFDERRLADLARITTNVDCYTEELNELPETLSAVEDYFSKAARRPGVDAHCTGVIPTDPRSGETYEYQKLDQSQFRVCAEFEQAWPALAEENRQRILFAPGISIPAKKRRTVQLPKASGQSCFNFAMANEMGVDP
ncbi:MAG: DUF5671 domain-containing protein [Pseudomonadota bacterium]